MEAGLAFGSKVLVILKNWEILESVLDDVEYCKSIMRLEQLEAGNLFFSVVAPSKPSL